MGRNQIIGIDLGGTNLRGGIICNGALQPVVSLPLNGHRLKEKLFDQIFNIVDEIVNEDVKAIGIAVPGLVSPSTRVLYDVVNVPSLNGTNLPAVLEQRYGIPVKVENDGNCFALGEFYFGGRRDYTSIVGLTIGTGLGAGIIVDGKLIIGKHGGAGEFGMIKYLDNNFEYYVSGRFFENVYGLKGEIVYKRTLAGDQEAMEMYNDFGRHLGEAIKLILYTIDTNCFILGGSVKAAFPFYSKSMWEAISTFEYPRAIATLKIEPSSLENSNILGAAALHLVESYS